MEEEGLISKMRRELERMEAVNRELERRLFVEAPRAKADMERLREDLSSERIISADLRRELALAVGRSARLAQLLERNSNAQREKTANYEAKLAELSTQIKRLNSLLVTKTKSRSIGPTAVRLSVAHQPPHIQRRTQSSDHSLPFGILPTDTSAWAPEKMRNGMDRIHPPPLGIDGGQSGERKRKDCAKHRQKLLQQQHIITADLLNSDC